MYKVKKLFRVPVGHRLSKHEHLCKNFHGHNLKIEVGLMSEELNDDDMVIDFADLKKIVKEKIEDPLDHGMIMNMNDNQLEEMKKLNCRLTIVPYDPTAERLCKYIYEQIQTHFEGHNNPNKIRVDFVRIWENDNSMAEYCES